MPYHLALAVIARIKDTVTRPLKAGNHKGDASIISYSECFTC
jgi:hypothetical protein